MEETGTFTQQTWASWKQAHLKIDSKTEVWKHKARTWPLGKSPEVTLRLSFQIRSSTSGITLSISIHWFALCLRRRYQSKIHNVKPEEGALDVVTAAWCIMLQANLTKQPTRVPKAVSVRGFHRHYIKFRVRSFLWICQDSADSIPDLDTTREPCMHLKKTDAFLAAYGSERSVTIDIINSREVLEHPKLYYVKDFLESTPMSPWTSYILM